ncbi:unnamed protein product, partial [Rotaria sp. Silwood2]
CAMTHAIGHLDFAGKDLTDHFIKLLNGRRYSFESKIERENVRVMKESLCLIDSEIRKTEDAELKSDETRHSCPNFTSYFIKGEPDKCSEILFDPKDIGRKIGEYSSNIGRFDCQMGYKHSTRVMQ